MRGGGQVGELVDVVGQVLVGGQQWEPAGQVQGQVAGDQHRGRVDGVPAGAIEAHQSARQGIGGPAPGLGVEPMLAEADEFPLDPVNRSLRVHRGSVLRDRAGENPSFLASTAGSAASTISWPAASATGSS